jgi:SAM-dependent methyltransferase
MSDTDDARAAWNRLAADWRIQVGDDGDANRRLNSDPVLWRLVGDVQTLRVLDAGCGTGYLTKKLAEQGAEAIGVDFADAMISIARSCYPGITFRVDSVSELATIPDLAMDLVVSNYVLMDAPDLEGALRSFHRVLRGGGRAVLVFSHPCFPQDNATVEPDAITYRWTWNYFERSRRVDPPWRHFKDDFIWFHRPLSDYFKAFTSAGFAVLDLEEPRITPESYRLVDDPRRLSSSKRRPYSIAFRLEKR